MTTYSMLPASILALCYSCLAVAGPPEDTAKGMEAFQRQDLITAMQYYRKAADAGYAPAQVKLAYLLDQAESNEEAVELYRKAAEQNYAEGTYGLGVMYASGEGVEQDSETAVKLITTAAEQGLTMAIRHLITLYEHGGLGIDQNLQKAVNWLEKGANLGDRESLDRLVRAYQIGELGLAVNEEKAAYWQAKSPASAGDDTPKK